MSRAGADRCPAVSVATITSVCAPGLSLWCRGRRPSKRTLLTPGWAVNASAPPITGLMHLGLCALRRVRATQRWSTVRPARLCVNTNLTVAVSFISKLNVVPTRGLCRALMLAFLLPSTQRRAD